MGKAKVAIFKPYPFEVGQKIYIDDGPRKGDWEVLDVSGRKIKLRCPISAKEFEWNRFCYFLPKSVITRSGRIKIDIGYLGLEMDFRVEKQISQLEKRKD